MTDVAIRDLLLRWGEELFRSPRQIRHFTNVEGADALLNDLDNYPHAFVLACVMDRQMKAERAWLIPYLISQKIGGFDFPRLRALSTASVQELMTRPVPLHRFPKRMGENFHDALLIIDEVYAGDASNIWRGKPSSAEVVYRFLQLNLAALIRLLDRPGRAARNSGISGRFFQAALTPSVTRRDEPLSCGRLAHESCAVRGRAHAVVRLMPYLAISPF